ncbi:hypothetical protein CDAR_269551, partial [Caerostris darwini]
FNSRQHEIQDGAIPVQRMETSLKVSQHPDDILIPPSWLCDLSVAAPERFAGSRRRRLRIPEAPR